MLCLARLARFDHQPGARARPLADQMMMHGAGCEQARDRRVLAVHAAIGKHDYRRAVRDCLGGAAAQALQRAAQSGLALGDRIQRRERDRAQARRVQPLDFFQLHVGQHRAPEFELAAVLGRFLEQVLLRADRGDRGGDHLFADRIDRRIGHLGEELFEVVEQQRRFVRQHRQRRVGAHRAHRLLSVDRHRRQDHLQLFGRIAEGLLLLG